MNIYNRTFGSGTRTYFSSSDNTIHAPTWAALARI